ncbi:unnamed protein product [Rhizoctonia solani]|uniref:Helicase ATP-binding domain-containing protein n=1 Tax=Rhizoctonia solani TaxID=456999 RepID=A0A8H3B3E6_9AGAM|nr:unnamed protein product [Rhizoctonia solani]
MSDPTASQGAVRQRPVLSQCGTGKTATFAISVLQSINTSLCKTQALVLLSTHELASQIQSVILTLGKYMNVQCHACVGGTPIREDICKLGQGQQVVSGTPGHILDMIHCHKLRTANIKMLILNGVDELFSKGFKNQISNVYWELPSSIQVMVLTPTLPASVLEMTNKFMVDPIHIIGKGKDNHENYVHRISCSGHPGNKRTVIKPITNNELHTLREIEQHYSVKIGRMPASGVGVEIA